MCKVVRGERKCFFPGAFIYILGTAHSLSAKTPKYSPDRISETVSETVGPLYTLSLAPSYGDVTYTSIATQSVAPCPGSKQMLIWKLNVKRYRTRVSFKETKSKATDQMTLNERRSERPRNFIQKSEARRTWQMRGTHWVTYVKLIVPKQLRALCHHR